MKTLAITLPDQLAQEAERAGLLSAESLENLLRERLRMLQKNAPLTDVAEEVSPETMTDEVRAIQQEQHAGRAL